MKALLTNKPRKKTDNVNVDHKVYLRKQAVKDLKELKVLDLFAGMNVLWGHFDCDRYYGVEMVKGKGNNLNADNVRVIESLDLSDFNVIDCDSYGIPTKQIEQIYANKTLQRGTIIIYTCIGNAFSGVTTVALKEVGLDKMYKKCKVLFNKLSNELFYVFLYNHGVRRVYEYEEEDSHYIKRYGYFIVE